MKQLIKLGVLSPLLFLSTPSFALTPVGGFYGGLFAEMSHGPSSDIVYFREDDSLFTGTADYSPISGGAGVMIGYKYKHFRTEAEFFFNRISTGPVTVGTCVIENQNVVTPTGVCTPGVYDSFQAKALGYSGNSTAVYGLLNVFWDFFSYENTDIATVPYIGIGAGYAQVKNGNSYINTINQSSHGESIAHTGMALQGILGISYYLDDYAWIAMDYRFVSAKQSEDIRDDIGVHIPSNDYGLHTINIGVNVAFDKGAIDNN
jgi:opacity protein-like surface antigen